MRFALLGCAGLGLLLAGCGGEEIAFRSDQERQCYAQANAALGKSKNKRLVRAQQTGDFVVVTQVQGIVRDIKPSPEFDACMASNSIGLAPQVSEGAPVQFTGDELVIWNSLSDQAKKDALLFIQQGGTLSQFVSQG
ncbi:hypothetical protein [Algicella marina]|uniref:Lipoprotein n=1 Tax=Algicella marina TaxID=2683284 RepID=A0A6P1T3G3_9RHOB|nr:hypothetical protein [Algicella marina]QHQ36260.1 hypothetical protein GO499_14310 [Algicella marina]